MPAPVGDGDAPLQALIFDSAFDTYRGVIAYVRVKRGRLPSNAKIKMFATGITSEAEEAGVMSPEATPVDALGPGEVGYLVTGLKDVHQAKVGDTITLAGKGAATEPLHGYREPKPMVWSGLFPADGSDYSRVPRGVRQAEALGLGARLRTGDLDGARVRVPGRVPRAAAHGHRARAAGARVRPGADLDGAQRRVPRVQGRRGDGRAQPGRDAARRRLRAGRGAHRVRDDHHAERVPRARSSSCARRGAARWST